MSVDDMADEVLYEVEKILGKKVLPNRKVVYLVHWRGFSTEHDSWEPVKNLGECRPLINKYNKEELAKSSNNTPVKHEDSTVIVFNKSGSPVKVKPGTPVKGQKSGSPVIVNKPGTPVKEPVMANKQMSPGKVIKSRLSSSPLGKVVKRRSLKNSRKPLLIAKKRISRTTTSLVNVGKTEALSPESPEPKGQKGFLKDHKDIKKKVSPLRGQHKPFSLKVALKKESNSPTPQRQNDDASPSKSSQSILKTFLMKGKASAPPKKDSTKKPNENLAIKKQSQKRKLNVPVENIDKSLGPSKPKKAKAALVTHLSGETSLVNIDNLNDVLNQKVKVVRKKSILMPLPKTTADQSPGSSVDQGIKTVKISKPNTISTAEQPGSVDQSTCNKSAKPNKPKKLKSLLTTSSTNSVATSTSNLPKTKIDDVIVVDQSSDEDDDVLYSLNDDCDNEVVKILDTGNVKKCSNEKPKKGNKKNDCEVIAVVNIESNGQKDSTGEKSKKVGKNKEPSKKTKVKANSQPASTAEPKQQDATTQSQGQKKKQGRKKSWSLMDSKKHPTNLVEKSALVRSASPPCFTTVRHMLGQVSSSDPSTPSGNSLPDPVSPEASETYLADVPTSYSIQDGARPMNHDEKESNSPASISYQTFIEQLPDLMQKGGKKRAPVKSKETVQGLMGPPSQPGLLGINFSSTKMDREPVERRTSVRSSECAFRYKQIVVKKCQRYTQIWLNTQTVCQNALNPQVIQEVVSAMNSAKYDDSHLVLFSSLGNVFCSGTDLHYLVSGDRRLAARQMAESIRELTKTFITFPKPVIAAVSGATVGLGVSLLALCDIVYASDKASFHLPYSQLSQTPEGCSSFTLPLMLGLPSANELLFGGRKITAMEAYQLGLVSQVFWPTLMMQEVIPRAQAMTTCSAKALEATKLLIRSHHRTKMEMTNDTEVNLLMERWSSVDCQRAVEAYLSNDKNLAF